MLVDRFGKPVAFREGVAGAKRITVQASKRVLQIQLFMQGPSALGPRRVCHISRRPLLLPCALCLRSLSAHWEARKATAYPWLL